MRKPKLIAVVGTNASGKSALGLELAQKFGGEIISADSRQIYRGFDLCSGKITPEESRLVPHHLINIRDIGEPFSAAEFQELVYELVPEIIGRGKLPFIVGGTGLYISGVVRGYDMRGRAPDLALRAELEKLSIDELKGRLSPQGKAFLDSKPDEYKNKRRIIRVLENSAAGYAFEYENTPLFDVLQIGVTWPKEILHQRIEARLTDRINKGMIDEVKAYLDNGGSGEHLYDLGLEYRHILKYLTGEYAAPEEFYLQMSRAIKRFAKRQMTWFKRDKTIRWLDMTENPIARAESEITEFLAEFGQLPV